MHFSPSTLAEIAHRKWPDLVRKQKKGKIIYWQGDPVDNLFVVLKGLVKVSSVSESGKIHSYGIIGRGHLLGATDYFLDGIHETTAETKEESELVVIPQKKFQESAGSRLRLQKTVCRYTVPVTSRRGNFPENGISPGNIRLPPDAVQDEALTLSVLH